MTFTPGLASRCLLGGGGACVRQQLFSETTWDSAYASARYHSHTVRTYIRSNYFVRMVGTYLPTEIKKKKNSWAAIRCAGVISLLNLWSSIKCRILIDNRSRWPCVSANLLRMPYHLVSFSSGSAFSYEACPRCRRWRVHFIPTSKPLPWLNRMRFTAYSLSCPF